MTFKKMLQETNYKNLTRYIPTGSKVKTTLTDKSLSITIEQPVSAPPLTTKDIPHIEQRLLKNVELFVKDIQKDIQIQKVQNDKYVFIQGLVNEINLVYTFTIYTNKSESTKLKNLDDALAFYKKSS